MNKSLIMWVLIGAGIVLVYAAYKGKSPKSVVTDTLSSVKG